jgi:hypothetical protein
MLYLAIDTSREKGKGDKGNGEIRRASIVSKELGPGGEACVSLP